MLTFPIFSLPSYSPAISSSIGAIILHGPHHSAQKSTRTGVGELITSSVKLVPVKTTTLATAISIPSYEDPVRSLRVFDPHYLKDSQATWPATPSATSIATTAKPLSIPLTPDAPGAVERELGACRGAAAAPGRCAGAGVGGAAEADVAKAAATGAAGAGVAAATAEGAGILIVGAAVGFGGKLIRTVSFLGCTLAASAGFGGRAPAGGFGIFSDIALLVQPKIRSEWCQMLNPIKKGRS